MAATEERAADVPMADLTETAAEVAHTLLSESRSDGLANASERAKSLLQTSLVCEEPHLVVNGKYTKAIMDDKALAMSLHSSERISDLDDMETDEPISQPVAPAGSSIGSAREGTPAVPSQVIKAESHMGAVLNGPQHVANHVDSSNGRFAQARVPISLPAGELPVPFCDCVAHTATQEARRVQPEGAMQSAAGMTGSGSIVDAAADLLKAAEFLSRKEGPAGGTLVAAQPGQQSWHVQAGPSLAAEPQHTVVSMAPAGLMPRSATGPEVAAELADAAARRASAAAATAPVDTVCAFSAAAAVQPAGECSAPAAVGSAVLPVDAVKSGGKPEKPVSKSGKSERAADKEKASVVYKYHATIDWSHYAPDPKPEQSHVRAISVADAYWQVVYPIRSRELSLDRNKVALHREHGPFSYLRRSAVLAERAAAAAQRANKALPAKPAVERIVYKDDDGEEFEVTADRKRKLRDISGALGALSLCPLLVRIWEKDGTPITPANSVCGCKQNSGMGARIAKMSTATGCSAATGATVTLSGAAARSAEQKRSREAAEAAEAANGCAASRPIVTEAAHAVPSKPRSRAKLNAGSRSASEAGTKMEVGSPSRPVGLAEINVRRPLKPSAAPSGHAAPASSRRSGASAMRAAGGSRRRSGAKIEAAAEEETLTAASLLPAEAEAECRMGLLWQLLTGPQSKERVGAATRFLPDDSTSSGALARELLKADLQEREASIFLLQLRSASALMRWEAADVSAEQCRLPSVSDENGSHDAGESAQRAFQQQLDAADDDIAALCDELVISISSFCGLHSDATVDASALGDGERGGAAAAVAAASAAAAAGVTLEAALGADMEGEAAKRLLPLVPPSGDTEEVQVLTAALHTLCIWFAGRRWLGKLHADWPQLMWSFACTRGGPQLDAAFTLAREAVRANNAVNRTSEALRKQQSKAKAAASLAAATAAAIAANAANAIPTAATANANAAAANASAAASSSAACISAAAPAASLAASVAQSTASDPTQSTASDPTLLLAHACASEGAHCRHAAASNALAVPGAASTMSGAASLPPASGCVTCALPDATADVNGEEVGSGAATTVATQAATPAAASVGGAAAACVGSAAAPGSAAQPAADAATADAEVARRRAMMQARTARAAAVRSLCERCLALLSAMMGELELQKRRAKEVFDECLHRALDGLAVGTNELVGQAQLLGGCVARMRAERRELQRGGVPDAVVHEMLNHERTQLKMVGHCADSARKLRMLALRFEALEQPLKAGSLPFSKKEPQADAVPLASGLLAPVLEQLETLRHVMQISEEMQKELNAELRLGDPDSKKESAKAASKSSAAKRAAPRGRAPSPAPPPAKKGRSSGGSDAPPVIAPAPQRAAPPPKPIAQPLPQSDAACTAASSSQASTKLEAEAAVPAAAPAPVCALPSAPAPSAPPATAITATNAATNAAAAQLAPQTLTSEAAAHAQAPLAAVEVVDAEWRQAHCGGESQQHQTPGTTPTPTSLQHEAATLATAAPAQQRPGDEPLAPAASAKQAADAPQQGDGGTHQREAQGEVEHSRLDAVQLKQVEERVDRLVQGEEQQSKPLAQAHLAEHEAQQARAEASAQLSSPTRSFDSPCAASLLSHSPPLAPATPDELPPTQEKHRALAPCAAPSPLLGQQSGAARAAASKLVPAGAAAAPGMAPDCCQKPTSSTPAQPTVRGLV